MRDYLKKKLNVPENWDKYDYQTQRYSFEDVEEILQQYEDEQLKSDNTRKSLFEVSYQGQDNKGLIVKSIILQAESENDAIEKIKNCKMQLKIYSSCKLYLHKQSS